MSLMTKAAGKCCARLGAAPPAAEIHVVAVSSGFLYDLSLNQANDISNGLALEPMVFDITPEQFEKRRKGYGIGDHAVFYDFYPDDRSFEKLDDWTFQHQKIDNLRQKIIGKVREDLPPNQS